MVTLLTLFGMIYLGSFVATSGRGHLCLALAVALLGGWLTGVYLLGPLLLAAVVVFIGLQVVLPVAEGRQVVQVQFDRFPALRVGRLVFALLPQGVQL